MEDEEFSQLLPEEQLKRIWNELIRRNGGCSENDDDDTSSSNNNNNNKNNRNECSHSSKRRFWPNYDTVFEDMLKADYNEILTCPHNLRPFVGSDNQTKKKNDNGKTLCPHGVIGCVKMELFPLPAKSSNDERTYTMKPYTGLLTPGTTLEHCLMRLSSAVKPPLTEVKSTFGKAVLFATGSEKLRKAQLFPTSAIKVFRGQQKPSGNILFAGSKVGHRETDYFAHCQCTQTTEKMPTVLKPMVRKFWKYSDNPLALGLSDFCEYDVHGDPPPSPTDIEQAAFNNFPFCAILYPKYKSGNGLSTHNNQVSSSSAQVSDATTADTTATTNSTASITNAQSNNDNDHDQNNNNNNNNANAFDAFIDEALSIPIGTVLFDIFACPSPKCVPDPKQLQRIGQVVTTSKMMESAPNDGIFFRHQRKEEDLQLRPNWKDDIKKTQILMPDDGKTKGNVGKLAGWKLFEHHINMGQYVDFQKCSHQDQE